MSDQTTPTVDQMRAAAAHLMQAAQETFPTTAQWHVAEAILTGHLDTDSAITYAASITAWRRNPAAMRWLVQAMALRLLVEASRAEGYHGSEMQHALITWLKEVYPDG